MNPEKDAFPGTTLAVAVAERALVEMIEDKRLTRQALRLVLATLAVDAMRVASKDACDHMREGLLEATQKAVVVLPEMLRDMFARALLAAVQELEEPACSRSQLS